ncbi:MAG TPA: tripartite tricarboxylate transporter substrate binding protein [Thermodesulfobacteriota bacterium]|nr:tripartite tricarboxylate transporter substrate binding protein [Thermodesulfobacteriota bacterium]
MHRKLSILSIEVVVLFFVFCATSYAQWKPEKPINLIVPWGAGGSTDQVTRIVAGELEGPLGQKIVAVNQPGASGTVGTKTVMDAKKDGYYWASGAAGDLGTYKVKGFLDTTIADWHLYLDVANVMVVSVNPNTPYKDFGELLKAFKENPGKIPVATAGEVSMGAVAIEAIKKHTGIQYKHVSYDGGNPAVIATVSGEAQVTPQLAVEQVDMIRANKLRPLAALTDEDLNVKGYGTIPSIRKWIPNMRGLPSYFGIFVPKGVPNEVVQTLDNHWAKTISNSAKLKDYANDRAALFTPHYGKEAQEKVFPFIQFTAWLYWDAGKAKVKPDTIGIPRP